MKRRLQSNPTSTPRERLIMVRREIGAWLSRIRTQGAAQRGDHEDEKAKGEARNRLVWGRKRSDCTWYTNYFGLISHTTLQGAHSLTESGDPNSSCQRAETIS